ncbi:MAG TPA: VPDSG-CTERM sorting domain-containing protein [Lacunisphaera sp.]|nr:VPDSG-CTERM sorting domain-containing protein [Lacunisphaera sp.]
MKSTLTHKLPLIALAAFATSTLVATPFGTNVTISDGNYTGTGWYSNREDQETETNPNTVTSQQWDLEGMFQNGTQLTLVAGYDFKNGVTWTDGHNYKSGDIFIDVNGDAQYGPANNGTGATGYGPGPHAATTSNTFGYDYVLDLNYTTMTYNVIALTPGSLVTRVVDVESSNPWSYASGGTAVVGYQNVAFSYLSGLTNAYTGFQGDSTNTTGWSTGTDAHFAITVDMSFMGQGAAKVHYTMECGNDNMMGYYNTPDTGATVLMFGLGLASLVVLRRKRSN